MSRARLLVLSLVPLGVLLAACKSEEVVRGSARDHGEALFADPGASPSTLNAFSCASCHATSSAEVGRILPGAPLAGVTARPTFWGGAERDLLPSVNHCRFFFMGASKPWTESDEEARALWAYLDALPKETTTPVPFTVVRAIEDVVPGDPKAGADVYARSCKSCHGAAKTGEGRLQKRIPILPDDTLAEHKGYTPFEQRLVFVEKVRHGGFLGYGGNMPLYSKEALTDVQLSAVLTYLGL